MLSMRLLETRQAIVDIQERIDCYTLEEKTIQKILEDLRKEELELKLDLVKTVDLGERGLG